VAPSLINITINTLYTFIIIIIINFLFIIIIIIIIIISTIIINTFIGFLANVIIIRSFQ